MPGKQEAGSPEHQESLQRSIDCFTKVVEFRTDNGERTDRHFRGSARFDSSSGRCWQEGRGEKTSVL